MKESIFELARAYDFDGVKRYVEQGSEINICNKEGNSLFAEFIAGYTEFGDMMETEADIQKTDHTDDYLNPENYLSKKQKTSLKERNSDIIGQINWFLDHGADIDLCTLTDYDSMVCTPLAVAVMDEDYFLTEFLLEKGADPKVRLFMEEEWEKEFRSYHYEDFLIEHMDVIMIDAKGERWQNAFNIACLLARFGLVDFQGCCITIDKEKKTIIGHGMRLLH